MKTSLIFALLLAVPVFAQTSSSETAILEQAAIPGYPPIARAAHITGKVVVNITVNAGKVTNTKVKSGNHFLALGTVANLNTWRFQNDVYGTFTITYTYSISGGESLSPTNPHVEILPSLDVNITVRPVKPTVNY